MALSVLGGGSVVEAAALESAATATLPRGKRRCKDRDYDDTPVSSRHGSRSRGMETLWQDPVASRRGRWSFEFWDRLRSVVSAACWIWEDLSDAPSWLSCCCTPTNQ